MNSFVPNAGEVNSAQIFPSYFLEASSVWKGKKDILNLVMSRYYKNIRENKKIVSCHETIFKARTIFNPLKNLEVICLTHKPSILDGQAYLITVSKNANSLEQLIWRLLGFSFKKIYIRLLICIVNFKGLQALCWRVALLFFFWFWDGLHIAVIFQVVLGH